MHHALSTTAKRGFALIGAAAIGTIAALGAGTPAFACHTIFARKIDCVTGQPTKARITWTITNSEKHLIATVVSASPQLSDASTPKIGDIKAGQTLGKSGTEAEKGGALDGTTIVDIADVALTVTLRWNDKNETTNTSTDPISAYTIKAALSTAKCNPPKPPEQATPVVEYKANCDGSVGVGVSNPAAATESVVAEITGTGGYKKVSDAIPPGKSAPTITVPAANASDIKVFQGTGENRKPVGNGTSWSQPDGCAAPDVTARGTCDGRSVVITNPAGNRPLDAIVTANDVVQKVKVEAGTSQTVTIAKDIPVLEATVKIGGNVTTVRFDNAKDCVKTPVNTTPPANAGPTLPVTGGNVALIGGGAASLIGLGGALFWLARRRRIQFTA